VGEIVPSYHGGAAHDYHHRQTAHGDHCGQSERLDWLTDFIFHLDVVGNFESELAV